MPFSRGFFPNQGLNPGLLHLQADSLLSEPPGKLLGSPRLLVAKAVSKDPSKGTPWHSGGLPKNSQLI